MAETREVACKDFQTEEDLKLGNLTIEENNDTMICQEQKTQERTQEDLQDNQHKENETHKAKPQMDEVMGTQKAKMQQIQEMSERRKEEAARKAEVERMGEGTENEAVQAVAKATTGQSNQSIEQRVEPERDNQQNTPNQSPGDSFQETLDLVFHRVEAKLSQMQDRYISKLHAVLTNTLSPEATASSSTISSTSSSSPRSSSPCNSTIAITPQSSYLTLEDRENLERDRIVAVQKGKTEVRRLFNADEIATHLWEAVSLGDATMVSLLLGGVDVNAKNDDGDSALHFAARCDKDGQCLSLIIDAGADVHSTNSEGDTPLHYAAFCNNEVSVRALLAAGASKTARNEGGHTPFEIAGSPVRNLLGP